MSEKERYERHKSKDPDAYRAKAAIRAARWRENNPEKYRESYRNHRLKRYGIDEDRYQDMVKTRNNRCDICHLTPEERGSKSPLGIDHNHLTGQVRGLLCWPCNMAIGLLQDSLVRLADAIDYLSD